MTDPKKPAVPTTLAEEQARLNTDLMQTVVNTAARSTRKVRFAIADLDEDGALTKSEEQHPLAGTPLHKSVLNSSIDIKRGKEITRLAFEEDPTHFHFLQSLWVPKPSHVLPDHTLKQISYRDSLVATILNTRANQISAFGRELQDRFATGYRIEPRPGVMEDATDEQKEALQKKIVEVSKILGTCGSLEGTPWDERMSMSTFLSQQTHNGLVYGRFATEVLYSRDPDGTRKFHSFRPIDVSTVFRAAPRNDTAQAVRDRALAMLQTLKGPNAEKLQPEKFKNEEYAWIQVLHGRPAQAFTPDELIVHTLYPNTDINMHGYPITPVDTVVDGVATHMNIVQHNKLYFQSGRAARGMIVIKSTDVDQGTVAQIRQHFNASINSVSNSWRVPVFAVDPEDEISWQAMEMSGGRDMEFQYLSDQNAREICSAFQISPEELPGYQHLSRGTNSQALSESSNEYKLEAARDVGIRPLLNHFQDFLNDTILPLVDPIVAQLCTLKLYGLDADTAEKESTRLQQDMPLHLTMDEILERTEKDPLGKEWAGRFLLNPGWQAVLDKYFPVGMIMEHFFDMKGASKDQGLQYVRDPFWFNFQQLQMQAQQMEMQAQQMQMEQQAAQQQAQAQQGGQEGDGGEEQESELASGAEQVMELLGKSEKQLPPNKRRLLALHKKIVKDQMNQWQKDSEEALAAILKTVADHKD